MLNLDFSQGMLVLQIREAKGQERQALLRQLLERIDLADEIAKPILADPITREAFFALLMIPPADSSKFSPRIEANAVTAIAFRNGLLEDYHAEGCPIDDYRMRDLMIDASRRMHSLLRLRDALNSTGPGRRVWERAIAGYHDMFCARWEVRNIGESDW